MNTNDSDMYYRSIIEQLIESRKELSGLKSQLDELGKIADTNWQSALNECAQRLELEEKLQCKDAVVTAFREANSELGADLRETANQLEAAVIARDRAQEDLTAVEESRDQLIDANDCLRADLEKSEASYRKAASDRIEAEQALESAHEANANQAKEIGQLQKSLDEANSTLTFWMNSFHKSEVRVHELGCQLSDMISMRDSANRLTDGWRADFYRAGEQLNASEARVADLEARIVSLKQEACRTVYYGPVPAALLDLEAQNKDLREALATARAWATKIGMLEVSR